MELTKAEKRGIRLRIQVLLSEHDVSNCETKHCVTCKEIDILKDYLIPDIVKRYSATSATDPKDIHYFPMKREVARFLKISDTMVTKAINSGRVLRGYYIKDKERDGLEYDE